MTLLQAWADSLSLLKPKNAKLFLLVTLNATKNAYKIIAHYWWWLILLFVAVSAFFQKSAYSNALFIAVWAACCLLYQLFLFVLLLSTRSTLEQKNGDYFKRHLLYFIPLIPFLFIFTMGLEMIAPNFFCFFTVLFFLDSRKRVKDFFFALKNSLMMIVYNFPLLIIIGFLLNLFYRLLYLGFVLGLFPSYSWCGFILCGICLLACPFVVCLHANIYIKKLHEQFDLYCKQPR